MTVSASLNENDPQINNTVDETTALLGPASVQASGAEDQVTSPDGSSFDSRDDAPLPLTQIFLLCYARLIDPVAYFSIFPFIAKMILDTGGIAEVDVGFYSGLIVSRAFLRFAFAQ
jgi:hypothetical protein